jgi:hypothetical protein
MEGSLFTISGRKMIATVLAQGDALRAGVADKIIGSLTDEIYRGLPATSLQPLLASESIQARLIGVNVALMSGPYAKDLLQDVRPLLDDPDPDVRSTAGHVMRQAVALGWIKELT